MIPRTASLGPRHRAKERRPGNHPWKSIHINPERTVSPAGVSDRTLEEGVYPPLKESLRIPILLYQKKGWETTTSSRLQESQRMDHLQPLPLATDSGVNQPCKGLGTLLQVQCTLGVQQRAHQRR